MPPVPTYDFPQSPILIIGFAGIVVALAVLYVVNKAYFNSPFMLTHRGQLVNRHVVVDKETWMHYNNKGENNQIRLGLFSRIQSSS